MGTETPKQFLLLAGKPVLMHAIGCFSDALPEAELVVVLPENQIARWASLCEVHAFAVGHTVVPGGETRFHSVKNALEKAVGADCVGVHDGVRPLASGALVAQVLEAARKFGAAIPAVPLTDSIRELVPGGLPGTSGSKPADRSRFVAVQTPQFFRGTVLTKAYEQEYAPEFTDDASVVEASGHPVALVPGDAANIKVTVPADLRLAEMWMSSLG